MMGIFIYFCSFILYLYTLFSGVAPYRDTGEMVSVAHTLGIAHPPGYPFYTLLSRLFLAVLPFGNEGYRLNVLSALAGAATVWFIYKTFVRLLLPSLLASFLALLLATSYLQWYLSLVSEMYTLNTLFAACLLYLLIHFSTMSDDEARTGHGIPFIAAFLFGIGLGNRMDLLLLSPAFLVIFWHRRRHMSINALMAVSIVFVLGLSIFVYLPIRSSVGPLLDWNHPATLSRLWGTLTRKTHGGTLDLISESYARGENFGATFVFYVQHLFSGFAYAGIPLAFFGIVSLWKRKRDVALATVAAWLVCGPLFIYLSNMPPNTHALAILEAHFLLPNVLCMLWIGEGLWHLTGRNRPWGKIGGAGFAGCLVLFNLAQNFPELNKRANFIAYDYSKNVLRSLPPGSILVMKKDVQLFSLWNRQLVEDRRPDVAVVSQGLSGSFWYVDKFIRRHPGVTLCPLHGSADWAAFLTTNRGKDIYFSCDAEYSRPDGYDEEPDGIVSRIAKAPLRPRGDVLLDYIYPYRGNFTYGAYREFFTPDIIEDYARAHLEQGQYFVRAGLNERGRAYLRRALAMRGLMPLAANSLAYSYFAEGNYARAKENYLRTIELYSGYQELAVRFKALPEVCASIARDQADAYIALGVCIEKSGGDEEALRYYAAAIDAYPQSARAYFNRAVIYWKRNDWQQVVRELESAVRIDPQFKEAAGYLNLARQKLR
jgi:tetratricopeptide (TPR) repeat protein